MNQPLAETIFWIAALSCAVAELAILRSTFAARRIEQSGLVPAASRGGELVWAIIPALVLVALLVGTWRRIEARGAHMQVMDHSGMQHSMPMPPTTLSPSVSRR
jgi:heme/copper-type cytochrome/quinol oxidase subunit 2